MRVVSVEVFQPGDEHPEVIAQAPMVPYKRYVIEADNGVQYLAIIRQDRHDCTVFPGHLTTENLGWYFSVFPDQSFMGSWPFMNDQREGAITAGLYAIKQNEG
jgi:hypothetical protein